MVLQGRNGLGRPPQNPRRAPLFLGRLFLRRLRLSLVLDRPLELHAHIFDLAVQVRVTLRERVYLRLEVPHLPLKPLLDRRSQLPNPLGKFVARRRAWAHNLRKCVSCVHH